MRRVEENFVDLKGLPPMRCDKYISEVWGLCSRSQIRALSIELLLDRKPAKWSQDVHNGQCICLSWNEVFTEFQPEKIDLEILYQDDDVWVINKPVGLVVHPGAGHPNKTLANGLAYLLGEGLDQFPDASRAGIVHRLDKDTSGVIICAKNIKAHEFLSNQFRQRLARKYYLAFCEDTHGYPPFGRVKNFIFRCHQDRRKFSSNFDRHGKVAVSSYRIIRQRKGYSLVLFKPYTGRTHQLRVHAKHWGFPIVGDPLYNPHALQQGTGLMLHAWKLKICLPSGGSTREFCAPLPQRFYKYWNEH